MRSALMTVIAFGRSTLAAHADTVYTYTGQYFTDVTSPYTTSDRVTGTFTTSSPLGSNLNDVSFTPESFSFTDGLQTLTQNNVALMRFFDFSTDANGAITGYRVELLGDTPGSSISASNDYSPFIGDTGTVEGEFTTVEASSEVAGSWTTPASVTPEPSSLALLATGLLGTAGVLRKRYAL